MFLTFAGIPLLTVTPDPTVPAATVLPGGVYDPPWPVEKFPAQVGKACDTWKDLTWPTAPRAKDYPVPGTALVIRGSNVYRNLGGDLPKTGHYREYDVNPRRPGARRDAERVVRDETAHTVWYTGDHYANFRKITSGCE
ncbi:guanine-specific ribonuclease N1 and T1 [Streptomyces eurocidicus]|uniref:Guanine-specific ribonuclease N1 and T1 n=1 Tax=Streptomyces eurocidicus TaxID=66423 RepID=A0A2N8P3W2_STREU|nr:guanine-specific ribonuclease N1 and T1 [Streptomyces eurocidicus]PNE35697.1 guanine-specific ribonuclease N1 and T1 [Streptomyces eurocidicus]